MSKEISDEAREYMDRLVDAYGRIVVALADYIRIGEDKEDKITEDHVEMAVLMLSRIIDMREPKKSLMTRIFGYWKRDK